MSKCIQLVRGTHWESVLWPEPKTLEEKRFLEKFWREYDENNREIK